MSPGTSSPLLSRAQLMQSHDPDVRRLQPRSRGAGDILKLLYSLFQVLGCKKSAVPQGHALPFLGARQVRRESAADS